MSEISSMILLAFFIIGAFLLSMIRANGGASRIRNVIATASQSPIPLREFLEQDLDGSRKRWLFREQSVISLTHRYTGRFDAAVLGFNQVGILEAVIERKYPTRFLPREPRKEDFFQASLYALALQDSGVSCSTTKLVTIYCLQEHARACQKKNVANCVRCKNASVMVERFRPSRTISQLRKMDDYWFRNKAPEPNPNRSVCIICPFSRDGRCQYSII